MTTSPIRLSRLATSTALLTLDIPESYNALTAPAIAILLNHLAALAANPQIRIIVITGGGPFFCTGMDLTTVTEHNPQQPPVIQTLFEAVDRSPKTTIALINGSCYGGGVGLAFACDIRIALPSVTFNLSEVKRGLAPATISRYLVREWGTTLAREAMITGRPVPASEMLSRGLIQYIARDLQDARNKVADYTEMIRTSAPKAISLCKELTRSVSSESHADSSKLISETFNDLMSPSEEAQHGLQEFRKTKSKTKIDWAAWYQERAKL
ncbi:3-hydroxypropionyl-coenzyme A dehydratase [Neolecta irregularis DAH-3]|uniref:3-hydroxypropionyl-coenzyme A dehydratase n=1 Tax=Neolecta irregularis (strain DAH-3) TaxID=1198029 RepID=A0A1U7LHT5_NEOID|nr:3-hydroxypropionyl-coenzyme A dehydratase [Neolecta irregularis DAH-3]|eukprot:OLL22220.1 3-hydroxypropionyl-coenzyme A dehydratase [Neolecta irregularis DAH-3]